jgi:hypothetical protein
MAVKWVVRCVLLDVMLDDVWALLYVLSNVFIIQIQVVLDGCYYIIVRL